MIAVFVIDVDKDELGEAVATITANDITFFARGVIRTLPQKIEGKREKFMPTYSLGWNDCLDAVELGLKPLWEKTE